MVKQRFASFCEGCICPPDFPQCVCGRTPAARLILRKPVAASEKELEENRLLQEAAHHSARFRKRYHLMSSRNFKESLQFVKEHATGLRQDRKDRFAQLKAERKNKKA